ncbi:hypothetical protein PoB_005289800 [Plakobranchus ocellatus]|uniref:Uncharacterized protein n=1 Tax=Plakobranchus ocellatus TaxID=259542 RepID=A0AAV4C393_9GAST|nr:hypothetical protein PoB_005289800 [Plakobranchus ocellatus]
MECLQVSDWVSYQLYHRSQQEPDTMGGDCRSQGGLAINCATETSRNPIQWGDCRSQGGPLTRLRDLRSLRNFKPSSTNHDSPACSDIVIIIEELHTQMKQT